MTTTKRAIRAYLLLIGVSVLQAGYYYPKLPDTVASHFNVAGDPDSWMSKDPFLALSVGLVTFIAVVWLGIHLLIARMPDSMVNLPHKDYWLAPQRRKQTHAFMASVMLWLACATMGLIIAVDQLVIQANLSEAQTLSNAFWVLLSLYLVFTVVWLVRLFLRFKRIPDDPCSN